MVRRSAEERLGRLLQIIPWVVERGGAGIDEIASRFDLPSHMVLAELSTAQCYEIPPYGPDNTLGIVVVDGRVEVEPGALLDRPLRLGPQEGFGLLVAGRAALAATGEGQGALASALTKLEAALGERAPVTVDLDRPAVTDLIEAALLARDRLEIDYYAASRDEVTTRRVDPVEVVHTGGDWFLHAWCHRAGGPRTFRLDRIEEVRPVGEHFEPPDVTPDAFRHEPGDDAPDVVLRVPAEARWVAESYPVRGVRELDDGSLELTLGLLSPLFLERLLVRLGPAASIVQPADLADAGARAARRILARYE
jgi:proteasome accessory factor C